MRVFISSTCHDLIDLRFELAEFFRQAGCEPYLSDDIDSGFRIDTAKNSIETCLENVRNCDAFIIILSQRYGPTLEKFGYGNLSATHLEYGEAVRRGKPIYMYVRDRLAADHQICKNNPEAKDLKLSWVKPKDFPIFDIFENHKALSNQKGNNWFWTFKHSLELKNRITKDFAETFARRIADSLFKTGRIPLFEIHSTPGFKDAGLRTYPLCFWNLSNAVAIEPVFKIKQETNAHPLGSIGGNSEGKFVLTWVIQSYDIKLDWSLKFSTLEGHEFEEAGHLTIKDSSKELSTVTFVRTERKYIGVNKNLLLSVDQPPVS